MESNLLKFEATPDDLQSLFREAREKFYYDLGIGNNSKGNASLNPISILSGVAEGERDEILFKYACRLRGKNLSLEEATRLVLEAAQNCKPPFPEPEAQKKIESAWKHSPGRARDHANSGEDRKLENYKGINFECITLENIYAEKCEEKPIIKGLLYEQDQTVIYAPGGVGKSLVTQDISMALACGMGFLWEQFEIPKPRGSLFVQSENSRQAVHQRTFLKCSGNSEYMGGLQNVIYASQHGNVQIAGHVSEKEFREKIIDFAKQVEQEHQIKIDIIIFDPLISYHDAEENDNSRMRTTLDHVLELSNEIEATPIIVHHANKEQGIRGASAISDWARNIIKLEDVSYRGEKRIKFTHEKCNNSKMFEPFIVEVDAYLNLSPLDFVESIPKGQKERGLQVKEALELIGGTAETKSVLVDQYKELTGIETTPTIHRHIDRAVKNGFINREYHMEGKVKKARFYIG